MTRRPFPGMDPYLEDPAFWDGFHDVLITTCMFEIEQVLPPGYVSNVKERGQVIGVDDPAARVYVPDLGAERERTPRQRAANPAGGGGASLALEVEPVTIASADAIEVREAYLEIRRMPGFELVTVIELLSPWNKHGEGVGIRRAKRASLVREGVHVVELDLLRGGTRSRLSEPLPAGDYYALIFRADRKPDVDVFAWTLRQKLPRIPIPLRAPDPDVLRDLAAAVGTAYERGRYDRKLRYDTPLAPPLAPAMSAEDAAWAGELLRPVG